MMMDKPAQFRWPLSKDVIVDVRFMWREGHGVTSEHLEMLIKYLEIAKAALGKETQ